MLAWQGLRRNERRCPEAPFRCNPILWVEPDCQAFREVFFLRGICAHLSEGWENNGIFVDNRVGIVKQPVNNGLIQKLLYRTYFCALFAV